MRLDWDSDKAQSNLAKHGVSFDQASELFVSGADYLEIYDEAHSMVEERFIAIGPISAGVVLVVFVETDQEIVRIISARMATGRERALYRTYMEAR